MSKVKHPKLPDKRGSTEKHLEDIVTYLSQWMDAAGTQINQLSEGQIQAAYNADTASPTGTVANYKQGDFVKNSKPTELGTVGSKYVLVGWVCTVSGAPGTWNEARVLTGN